MQEYLNKLSLGEKLVAGGGLLMLFAGLFLDWWHVSFEGLGSGGTGGFDDPGGIWSTLVILISVVLAGIVLAVKFGNVNMPALPANWTWGMVYGAGAGLVVLFFLLKAWRIMAAPVGGFGIGFFLALVATGLIGYGGFLLYNSDKGAGFQSLMNKKQ